MKRSFMLTIFVVALFLVAAFGVQAGQKDPKILFEETCSQCHSIDIPKNERLSKDDWAYTVGRMRNNGCSISDQEAATIIDYLAATYGKK